MSVPRERWTPAYDRIFDPDHELAHGAACHRFAWLDLCHNTRWEDGTRIINGVVVPLKRGEVLASLRWMAERWGWSVKKVRSFVNLLTHPDVAKLEVIRETPQGTVYRIVNYDTYANPGHTAGHSTKARPGAQPETRGEPPGGGPSPGSGHTRGHTGGHERGTPGAHPGHKEQQGTSRNRQTEGPSLGDPSEDGLARMIEEHPDVGAVLNGLEHPGGPEATAATLRQRFLYLDPGQAMPHRVVAKVDFDTRRRAVAAAFVEYRDRGNTEWSAKLFAGFVRRILEERSAKTGSSNGGFWG